MARMLPDMSDGEMERVISKALELTEKDTYQAMEALVHNLNTMHSRAGAQIPFSSINYGTDTSPEGRMVIRNVLLATEAGLGNGETPIFPIHIFKVKEGVNYRKGDPNYDLFRLACRVSAKRLFPNFSFIDAPSIRCITEKGTRKRKLPIWDVVPVLSATCTILPGKSSTTRQSELYVAESAPPRHSGAWRCRRFFPQPRRYDKPCF